MKRFSTIILCLVLSALGLMPRIFSSSLDFDDSLNQISRFNKASTKIPSTLISVLSPSTTHFFPVVFHNYGPVVIEHGSNGLRCSVISSISDYSIKWYRNGILLDQETNSLLTNDAMRTFTGKPEEYTPARFLGKIYLIELRKGFAG